MEVINKIKKEVLQTISTLRSHPFERNEEQENNKFSIYKD